MATTFTSREGDNIGVVNVWVLNRLSLIACAGVLQCYLGLVPEGFEESPIPHERVSLKINLSFKHCAKLS